MDWSSKLTDLFTIRQNLTNATSDADKSQYKKEEKELLSLIKNDSNLSIEDLVTLSSKKDIDNNDKVSDEEKNIFETMRDTVYDALARNINKNKNLKVSDMYNLEETIRSLSNEEQDDLGTILNKLQNRMVSNLTSQFFLTKESAENINNAKDNISDIWDAQDALAKLDEAENNPFTNSKAENLFSKLEDRVTRTLEGTYTSSSIEDAKNTKDVSKLVKKINDNGEENLDETKFSMVDGIRYYDGKVFSGTYQNYYYENGEIFSGLSKKNGNYYTEGLPANGVQPHYNNGTQTGTFFVENGKILYEDGKDLAQDNNTVRVYYDKYYFFDNTNTIIGPTINKEVVFDGQVETGDDGNDVHIKQITYYENGKESSLDEYLYNDDNSYYILTTDLKTGNKSVKKYTSIGEEFKGNGVFDGKFYQDNELVSGVYGNRLYEEGLLALGYRDYEVEGEGIVKFNNGFRLTGICNQDGKYYESGLIKEKAIDREGSGKVYFFGIEANGLYKEPEGTYNYYEGGKKLNTSELDENLVNFITGYNINNIKFAKAGGKLVFSQFSGQQNIDGIFRKIDYIYTDENNFTQTVNYENDIKLINKIEDGALTEAKYNVKGTEIDLNVDGNKNPNGIDYSLHYDNIDGNHPKVEVFNAIADNITMIYTCEDNVVSKQIIFASINDIQSGKTFGAYKLNDKTQLTVEESNNTVNVVIKDENIDGVTIEQTFGSDGKLKNGLIKFEDKEIALLEGDSCKIRGENIIVTQYNPDKTQYFVTTFDKNGTAIDGPNSIDNTNKIAEIFAEKLNLKLSAFEGVKTNAGKVEEVIIDGIKYNVSEKDNVITLINETEKIEKRFKNKVLIYEKAPSFGNTIEITERYENGVEKLYRMENSENDYIERHKNEQGIQTTYITSTPKYNEEENITGYEVNVITYAEDGNSVEKTEVTLKDEKAEKVLDYKLYVANDKLSYQKIFEENKLTEINYNITTGKKIDTTITEDNKETKLTYKADGTTVNNKTVTTFETVNGNKTAKTVENYDENELLTALTTFNSDKTKTIEKYTYENGTKTKTETESYNSNGLITKSEIKNASGKLESETKYENGLKTQTTTYNSYYENGKPKSVTREIFDGNIKLKTITGLYDELGVLTEYENGNISGGTDINGEPITKEQIDFAIAAGFIITDVVYDDGTHKNVSSISGIKYGRPVTYTNMSTNNGKYNYTETINLAQNNLSTTEDDILYVTTVIDNMQEVASIRVNGTRYFVNVKGADINNTMDAKLTTFSADETAGIVKVADVWTDGISRQREFTLNPATNKYEVKTTIALGSIEDVNDKDKKDSIPTFVINESTTDLNGDTILIPSTDNKVNVQYMGKNLVIDLAMGEKVYISKDGKVTGTYNLVSDGETTKVTKTYKFNDDGTISVAKLAYNDTTIDMENAVIDEENGQIKVTHEKTESQIGYDITYTLMKTQKDDKEYNIGDTLSGTIKLKNVEIPLVYGDTVSFSADYKKCTISNSTTKLTYTVDFNGKYSNVMFNNKAIDISDTDDVLLAANKLTVIKDIDRETGTLGYIYEYEAAENVGSVNMKSQKVNFTNITSINIGENETLTISSDRKSCTVVNSEDNTTIVYNADGTIKSVKIGTTTFSSSNTTSVSISGNNVSVTYSAENKIGYTNIYYLNGENQGNIKSQTLRFTNGETYTCQENETAVLSSNNTSCTITAKNGNTVLSQITYNADKTITQVKMANKTISLANATSVTPNADNTELTVKREIEGKLGYTIVYSLTDGTIKSQTIDNTNVRDITIGDTITVSGDGLKVTKANGAIEIYDKDGNLTSLTIKGQKIFIPEGATLSHDTEAKTITLSKTAAANTFSYNLIYDTETGKLKNTSSIKYGTSSNSVNLSADDVIVDIDNSNYFAVKNGDDLKIYDKLLSEINKEGFKLNEEGFKTFKKAITAMGTNISFEKITKNAIEIGENSVSFKYVNNGSFNYTINLDKDGHLTSYSVQQEKAQVIAAQNNVDCAIEKLTKDSQYTEDAPKSKENIPAVNADKVTVYNADNSVKEIQYTIDGKTFVVPQGANLTTSLKLKEVKGTGTTNTLEKTLVVTISYTANGVTSTFKLEKNITNNTTAQFALVEIKQGNVVQPESWLSNEVFRIWQKDATVSYE